MTKRLTMSDKDYFLILGLKSKHQTESIEEIIRLEGMKPCNLETIEPYNPETTEPPEPLNPETIEPYNPETIKSKRLLDTKNQKSHKM